MLRTKRGYSFSYKETRRCVKCARSSVPVKSGDRIPLTVQCKITTSRLNKAQRDYLMEMFSSGHTKFLPRGNEYLIPDGKSIAFRGLEKPVRAGGLQRLEWVRGVDEQFQFGASRLEINNSGECWFQMTLWVDRLKWELYNKKKRKDDESSSVTETITRKVIQTAVVPLAQKLASLDDGKSGARKHEININGVSIFGEDVSFFAGNIKVGPGGSSSKRVIKIS